MLSSPLRLAAVTRTLSQKSRGPWSRSNLWFGIGFQSQFASSARSPSISIQRITASQPPYSPLYLCSALRLATQVHISPKPHLVARTCNKTLAPQWMMIYYMHTASQLSVQQTSPHPHDDQSSNPTARAAVSDTLRALKPQLRFIAAPYSTSLDKSAYQTTSSDG